MTANFLIIGCEGREISIFRNLKKNDVNKIYFYTPYTHPFVYAEASGYKVFDDIINFSECYLYCVENQIKYVLICSEKYINDGIVDYIESFNNDIICIAPPQNVAKIETSKKFARNLLRNNGLNNYNPDYIYVTNGTSFVKIMDFINKHKYDIVVKANGLHCGNGVKVYGIHMLSLPDIINSIYTLLDSGCSLVLEERIDSDNEFTFMTFTDGEHYSHTFPIKDFKRLSQGNEGPNTESMGCIYDCNQLHYLNDNLIQEAKDVNEKVIKLLNKYKTNDKRFKGILYGSFIVDKTCNLRVIEFNARFGDPESVLIMESMKTDFGEVCRHIANKTLDMINIEYENNCHSMCKYLVTKGYPENRSSDFSIDLTIGEFNSSCIIGGVKGPLGFLQGTKSRSIAVYSTSNIDLYEAEAKIDIIMGKLINRNQNLFYYRTNITKDYEKYRVFNERIMIGLDLSTQLTTNNNLLDIDTGADNEYKSNDEHDEETDKILNSMIKSTVFEHVGSYLESGINIDDASRRVKKISTFISSTFDVNVVSEIGSFCGMYDLKYITQSCLNPVIVTSIDGVGTKSVFSVEHYELDGFEMLGEDIVNQSINNILVKGAMPLFFTDYFASSILNRDELYYLIKGVTKACKDSDCPLISGETAEMPNIYESGQHNLVGSIVGIVDKHEIINGKKTVKQGDVMVAISSSGQHTNGLSIIQKLYSKNKTKFTSEMIKKLAMPQRSYLHEYIKIVEEDVNIHGIAHITGGGLLDNIRRVVPDNFIIKFNKFEYSDIFKKLQQIGNISSTEMEQVFNCGFGMVFIVSNDDAGIITEMFIDATIIGNIV